MPPITKVSLKGAAAGAASIEIPNAASLGIRPGQGWEAISHGSEALLLLTTGQTEKGYLVGSLDTFSLPEVFGHIVSGVRSGHLVVDAGLTRKTVAFRDGQIVFASSTASYERLGAALVDQKLITLADLRQALSQVTPELRIGQVLVRASRVSSATLYGAMARLVRDIVVGLFEVFSGHFLFLESVAPEDVVKLTERTQDLVLEGVKRAEEVFRLRRRFPEASYVRRGPGPAPEEHPELLPQAAPLALARLREAFPASDYRFLGWVDACIKSGALMTVASHSERPVSTTAHPAVRSTLDLYGELISTICGALKSAGKDLSTLQSFFEDPLPGMEQAFSGVSLSADGRIDLAKVLANTAESGPAKGRAEAYDALHSFVCYALFSEKNILPQALAESLARQLRRLEEGEPA